MAAGTYVSWLAFDGDKIVGTSGMSFAKKGTTFAGRRQRDYKYFYTIWKDSKKK